VTKEKTVIIIAGPNGAGKTTFAREFLPREADCPTFINADLIAQGLSPFRPEQAVGDTTIMREVNRGC
jgi:predicted ABC-type ATPase